MPSKMKVEASGLVHQTARYIVSTLDVRLSAGRRRYRHVAMLAPPGRMDKAINPRLSQLVSQILAAQAKR